MEIFMKKISFGIGGLLMLSAMAVSDSFCVFAVYLFAALLHEMGHIIAAKVMKIGIKEIKFDFSGVRICTDSSLTPYKSEIILAISGPAVNLLAFLASALSWVIKYGSLEDFFASANLLMKEGSGNADNVIAFFALSSLVQALINLMPVESFDGGRILYCATAELFGDRVARRVTDAASALSAFLLWTVALYLMLKISSGLGIYVFAACIFLSSLNKSQY